MRFLLVPVLLAAGWCGGGTPQPTPPPPTPAPDPSPICPPVGATCGCYYMPPGQDWQQLPPCPTPTPGPVPTPTPTPGQGCVLTGEPSVPASSQPNTLGDRVNLAMKALRPECEIGGTCLLGNLTQQEWQAQVEAELRKGGLCAGQHTPATDELAVAGKSSDPWQGFHVFAGDDSSGPVPPGQPRRTVKWSPQAYTGAWMPPSVTPTPPPVQECPAPLPSREEGKLRIQVHVGGGWVDGTIQTVGTLGYCEAIGMSPMADGTQRASCPMRSECPGVQCDFRDECELYASGGLPKWQTKPGGLEVELRQGNPWVARAQGAAELRVCSADLSVCSAWVAAP